MTVPQAAEGIADQATLDAWWQCFVTTGAMPDGLQHVQGRLIRTVHCGHLPSGPVHVKTMTFPRNKDRLRYAFRALPAAHEASMLRLARQAGIPCPEVVAVRVQRRFGLPYRSMLVIRTIALGAEEHAHRPRLDEEIALAVRLLAAGIYHRDLHSENFVRAASGELCVLDMQSATRIRLGQGPAKSVRLAVAARLIRERTDAERRHAIDRMRALGLLRSEAEGHQILADARDQARRYLGSRITRCFTNSTEYERRIRATGIEYRRRGDLPAGRWWRGNGELRQAWIGQRIRQLGHGEAGMFAAFFQKWWWLGGSTALYVKEACVDERIEAEVGSASSVAQDPFSDLGAPS
jgi:hypothetical protein